MPPVVAEISISSERNIPCGSKGGKRSAKTRWVDQVNELRGVACSYYFA